MTERSSSLSVITFSAYGVTSPVRREAERINTHAPLHPVCKRLRVEIQRHKQDESERMEKDIQAKRRQERAGAVILISDIIGFEPKKITREKQGYYV